MEALHYEDSVEGRIVAYLDFMYSTAFKYLSRYQVAYGLDVQSDAQDITQEVIRKTLEADAYGPALGAGYFRTAAENACKDFIDSKQYEKEKVQNYSFRVSGVERTERAGWLTVRDAVRELPQAQRLAVVERYLGYNQGELTGTSQPVAAKALKRARKTLVVAIA